ncbi:hypothetical protein NP233_g8879 [Leucocoprinus birnbaumii]|uniref:Protein kinase domain-containing protein n=1 Tax=Leucocoprinus birnbaumii TaxID=56174 RepID=A0AAD5VS24_9AGAR|nr:hypothetical protein NP233_g8879 [Leucocoprinus birnbaumii]
MVDFLDERLLEEPSKADQRKYILNLLARICQASRCFPARLRHVPIDSTSRQLVSAGGLGIVYRGNYKGQNVCVKAIRTYNAKESIILPALGRDLALWAQADHPNVLPIYGVYMSDPTMKESICMVSPWADYGDLRCFLKKHPATSCAPLIADIILGLEYLHNVDLVHTELETTNILISNDLRAMIADFGITHILQGSSDTNTGFTGCSNWIAPELVQEHSLPTKASDIWGFACTSFEVPNPANYATNTVLTMGN